MEKEFVFVWTDIMKVLLVNVSRDVRQGYGKIINARIVLRALFHGNNSKHVYYVHNIVCNAKLNIFVENVWMDLEEMLMENARIFVEMERIMN